MGNIVACILILLTMMIVRGLSMRSWPAPVTAVKIQSRF